MASTWPEHRQSINLPDTRHFCRSWTFPLTSSGSSSLGCFLAGVVRYVTDEVSLRLRDSVVVVCPPSNLRVATSLSFKRTSWRRRVVVFTMPNKLENLGVRRWQAWLRILLGSSFHVELCDSRKDQSEFPGEDFWRDVVNNPSVFRNFTIELYVQLAGYF